MSLCLNKSVENELRNLSGNNICCDCDGKLPQWASVSFGIFMCLECSGKHRALGVHISFVRSVSMDSWSEKQIQMMRLGGNDKCNQFLKQYGIAKETSIAQKYNAPAALLYRDRMTASIEGRPLPTELPTVQSGNSSGVAQGTEPLPGESEAQYVARQRKLQEEARERMRQKFGASNGLSSGGKMAGIGSNPNYNADQQQSGSAIDLSEASQRAYSILSSSFAMIGDTVTKTAESYSSSNNSSNNSSHSASPAPSKTWSLLSTGAADLWNKATVATTDIVNIITAPVDEEAEMRFPRPPVPPSTAAAASNSTSTSASTNSSHSSSNCNNRSSQRNSNGIASSSKTSKSGMASNGSWDDLEDLLESSTKISGGNDDNVGNSGSKRGTSPRETTSTSGYQGQDSRRQTNMQSSNGIVSGISHIQLDTYRDAKRDHMQFSGSNHATSANNAGQQHISVKGTTPPLTSGHNSSDSLSESASRLGNSGSSSGSAVKKNVAAPSPVGDDFFATFGI